MNFVALKMLIGDRIKYLSLVAGLAFAALLVTQQASIFTGYARQTGAWIRDTRQADLWVMDDQVEFSDDIKPMLDTALNRVRGVDGVAWAVPMYKSYLNAILPDGTRHNVRVIGLDDATLTGGPPEMIEGTLADLRRDRGVIINVADAHDALSLKRDKDHPRPLGVGDRLSINDNEAQVVGTYRATKEFFWEPVIYTTYSRAVFMAPRIRRSTMFVLVKLQTGADAAQVAQLIQKSTGLKALTGDEFEAETQSWIVRKTGILINFGITIVLGFVIGLLVSGQTLFTFIMENTRYFAVIKAMGAGHWTLIRMVLVQVAVAGLAGFGLGLGGASITGLLFSQAGLAFEMRWQIPVFGAIAIMICCALAGLLSLIRVLRLEPAVVFKS